MMIEDERMTGQFRKVLHKWKDSSAGRMVMEPDAGQQQQAVNSYSGRYCDSNPT
jgi:hypothetical protein